MKKIISGVVIVMVLFSLVACGGANSDDPVVGKWTLDRAEAAGQVLDADMLAAAGLSGVELEMKGNGRVTLVTPEENGVGKWEKVGDGEYMIDDGAEQMELGFSEADDEVSLEYDGVLLIFKRQ